MDTSTTDDQNQIWTAWHIIAWLLFLVTITSCSAEADQSLPAASVSVDHSTATTADPREPRSSTTPPLPTSTVTARPTATEAPRDSGTVRTYTVETGDTLLALAQRSGVPMAAIQLQNGMGASTVLRAGQVLSLPMAAEWEGASAFWIVHEVGVGETLTAIAQMYSVELERLQEANDLDNADYISVGQQLVLPLTGPTALRTPTARAVAQAVPTTAPASEPSSSSALSAESPATPTPTAVATPVQDATPPQDLAPWPREIARLINEIRAEHGLPPFTYNETLQQAAQAHANDCTARGWCGHTGSDGASIKIRVRRAGYKGSGWAECWAQTQSPTRSVDIWMDEVPPNDPHRRTLLSDWLSEIGIGVADAGWGYYIIANFGRP